MYRHILAALDSSPLAPRILRHAAALAARTGAVLHVCHAVHVPVGLPVDVWSLSGDQLLDRLRDDTLRDLATLLAALPHDPPVALGQQVARFGVPYQIVTSVASEVHAELIVVGSHGYGVLDRILGTTADRIVHHAPCSVLVVREAEVASATP